jgi:hypothetical protein
MKVAIVSSVYGMFDKPREIPDQTHPYDLFFYNEANGMLRDELHPRLKAKYYKYAQHLVPELQGYDAYIWIDGNFRIISPMFVEAMVIGLEGHDIAAVPHNQRNCVFDEMDYIMDPPKFPLEVEAYVKQRYGHETKQILELYKRYWDQEMPQNWGLFSCGLFARLNKPMVNKAMDEVLLDCLAYSSQDQFGFPFYIWKHDLKVNRLPLSIVYNEYWKLEQHG